MALWDIKVGITLLPQTNFLRYLTYLYENHRAKQLDYLYGSSLNFKIPIYQNAIIFLTLCHTRLCNLLEVLLKNIDHLWFLGP